MNSVRAPQAAAVSAANVVADRLGRFSRSHGRWTPAATR